MAYRKPAHVLIAFMIVACSGQGKKQPEPANPEPASVGEPIVADDVAHDAARAARLARERDQRLQTLRTTLNNEPVDVLWKRGEDMDGKQNFKDAALAFTALVVHHPEHERAPKAAMRAMTSQFRTGAYAEGLNIAEDALTLIAHKGRRARLERVVGNAYLAIPHWGTKRGGALLRGQSGQGKQTHTFRADRKRAIEHLERARDTMDELTGADAIPLDERVAVRFDLVSALSRFTPFDSSWQHFWYAWAESADDDRVEEHGADEHAGRWRHGYSWWGQLSQHRPRGLEVTDDGQVVFIERPASYAQASDTTGKIKVTLHEIVTLDDTDGKQFASEALLRQGLLFRARDGTERLNRLGAWWHRGTHPFKKEVEGRSLHTLEDDQVLGLVATHLQVYRVPQDESFPHILRAVQKQYPTTASADRAGFLLGQFYQSRQQYDKAKAAYKAHITARPDTAHNSKNALATLEQPELSIVDMGVQPAGRGAKISVKFRNLDNVRFDVRVVDLDAITKDFKNQYRNGRRTKSWSAMIPQPSQLGWYLHNDYSGALKKYATQKGPTFERTIESDPSGRYVTTLLDSPLSKPGLYVLDAKNPKNDQQLARGLILVEGIAQVAKPGPNGNLLWVVDAMTGAPKAGAKVELFEHWNNWKDNQTIYHSRSRTYTADADGLVEIGDAKRAYIAVVQHRGVTSYTGFGYSWGRYYNPRPSDEITALVVTDRPVYRPGDTVEIKVWARHKRNGEYVPATDLKRIQVRVYDPQGTQLQDETHTASEFGAVHVKQPLERMAALGMYRIDIRVDGQWTRSGGNSFRVEEYKAPEFTVEVESAGDARLGENVPVSLSATYLFGGPVTDAKVRYKVYRQDYKHEYTVPGPWDWLYGFGYGRCFYIYPWFGWWHDAPPVLAWYPWWGPAPEPARELVLEGEGRLDSDGKLSIDIDTAPAKKSYGKTDHKYTIKAEVTDLSRRLIEGEGEILVTRASYFAHVEIDRGFYLAGDDIGVYTATQTTDGALFAQEGKLIVERVAYVGDNGATIDESTVDTLPVQTRAESPVRTTWRAPSTGLYKFTFVGTDDKDREVRSSAVAWVAGPGFHGRSFRFRGIEVYTDKRTYEVGDTARLLINANRADAHVLLSARAENGFLLQPRVIQIAGKSTVVDIPITAGDVPNFFVEAITVSEGELLNEIREVFVPPTDTALNVTIDGAKDEYRPGEEVELTVRTTDPQGKPVAADVAVSVFDKAVLYIQPELTPKARAHFWGQRRSHHVNGSNNLQIKFRLGDRLTHPDRQAAWQLSAAAREREQNETDWRHREGKLLGGDALMSLDQPAADMPNRQAIGGLLAKASSDSGSVANGRMVSGEKAKRESRAQAPVGAPAKTSSAVSSMDKTTLEDSERDNDSSQKDGPKNSTSGTANAKRVRRNFADTAHFAPRVRTDANGIATLTFKLPDNLTTWRVKAIGIDQNARIGEHASTFVSTKKLLIRLQAPRFFRERDRVVLSAIVHNKYDVEKTSKVTLRVDDRLLEPEGDTTQNVTVAAHGESRVDFWVTVKGEGTANVRMDVVAEGDSDAKELQFPVLVHGLVKTVSNVGSIAMGEGAAERTITLDIPKDRRVGSTKLHVRFSPTLAGGMLDALPYLLDYPYGCTEQTLSRFVPAVLTRKVLQTSGGLTLSQLAGMTNLNSQELTPDGGHNAARSRHEHKRFARGPVFDQALMEQMIAHGVRRLKRMQNSDGGWGWWGRDGSSRYTTAHVVDGLLDAQSADVTLPSGMLDRGKNALSQLVASSLYQYEQHEWVSNDDAYAAYVLSRYKAKNDKLLGYLFERRRKLTAYGKLLAALAFDNLKQHDKARTLLENAEQLLKNDDENETSWIETNTQGWWYWWNNDIETNAMYLRALNQMDVKGRARAPRVVKWLLNNRQNGYYWRSTRDTARVVSAFAHHMRISGESAPDMDVEILLDGKPLHAVHIDKTNLLSFDSEVIVDDDRLSSGRHQLTVRRKNGNGAVYFNSYLSYFSTEEDVQGTGLEVKVQRTYYKLVRDDRIRDKKGDRGQRVRSRHVTYRKVRLPSGTRVESGDLILVELMLESKNDYTFLAFEDPKPAGMEAVAIRSGTTYGEAVANMELRDDRVVFFLRHLHRGTLQLSYRLRAEIPGEFHAMPTYGFGMYAPELQTNSDEMRVSITDAE